MTASINRGTEGKELVTSQIVAWCRDCGYHVQASEIGGNCVGYPDCPRTLIKRRFWICAECGCHYAKQADALGHTCHECY